MSHPPTSRYRVYFSGGIISACCGSLCNELYLSQKDMYMAVCCEDIREKILAIQAAALRYESQELCRTEERSKSKEIGEYILC